MTTMRGEAEGRPTSLAELPPARPLPLHPGLEALRDGFCMLDAAWRVVYWNAAAERLLEVPRDAALGRPPWEVVPRLDEAGARARLAVAMAGGTAEYTLALYGDAGPQLAVEALPAEGGGIAVQFRDLAPERRVSERYERLLESLNDGFLAIDAQWRVVYVNRYAQTLLSVPPGRVLGTDLRALLQDQPGDLREALLDTMRDGVPRHLESVQPQGRVFRGRHFDVWTHPLPGGGLSILFEDVSDRLERERELARLAAEAEEASRAKSRFFAAVSHELRTPLNAIVGYTHLLGTGTYGGMPTGAERAAERAGVCAEHLARLVDDVLLLTTTELSRLPVAPRPVPLEGFLPAVLTPLQHQAEAKGLRFTLEVPAGLTSLETDPERLRQLLVALVSNAIKFTSRGEVRISVRAETAQERPAALREAGRGREIPAVEIAVADTGPGIAPEDRERIFDAFEQLGDPARHDSMTRGTGLGLTIARQLARLLRGTLEVDGAPGEGSTFRLRIPRTFGRTIL